MLHVCGNTADVQHAAVNVLQADLESSAVHATERTNNRFATQPKLCACILSCIPHNSKAV